MQARTTVKIFQMLDKIIFNPSSKVSRNDYHLFLLGGRENDIYKLFYLEGIIWSILVCWDTSIPAM